MLKGSREYAAIHARVIDAKPFDNWQADMLHYFVFKLVPVAETTESHYALFTMRGEHNGPLSALIIITDETGEQRNVVNLRDPASVQTATVSQP